MNSIPDTFSLTVLLPFVAGAMAHQTTSSYTKSPIISALFALTVSASFCYLGTREIKRRFMSKEPQVTALKQNLHNAYCKGDTLRFVEEKKRLQDFVKQIAGYEFCSFMRMFSEEEANWYESLSLSSEENEWIPSKEHAYHKVSMERNYRVILDHSTIQEKLNKQIELAKTHQHGQKDKGFQYRAAPSPSLFPSRSLKITQDLNCLAGIQQTLGDRNYQEDSTLATEFSVVDSNQRHHNIVLTGVFDGHGNPNTTSGKDASTYASYMLKKKLQKYFQECLDGTLYAQGPLKDLNQDKALTDRAIWNILKIACVELSDEYKAMKSKGGTTASFSLIINGEDLWTANVGDARTLIAGQSKILQLSEDARVSRLLKLRPQDLKTIQSMKSPTQNLYETSVLKRGGSISQGRIFSNGFGLEPLRSIGDGEMRYAVCARPKITKISLSKEYPDDVCFLCHATDGLWEFATSSEIGKMLWEHADHSPSEIARNMIYSTFDKRNLDNISAVVVKLDLKALRQQA